MVFLTMHEFTELYFVVIFLETYRHRVHILKVCLEP